MSKRFEIQRIEAMFLVRNLLYGPGYGAMRYLTPPFSLVCICLFEYKIYIRHDTHHSGIRDWILRTQKTVLKGTIEHSPFFNVLQCPNPRIFVISYLLRFSGKYYLGRKIVFLSLLFVVFIPLKHYMFFFNSRYLLYFLWFLTVTTLFSSTINIKQI